MVNNVDNGYVYDTYHVHPLYATTHENNVHKLTMFSFFHF